MGILNSVVKNRFGDNYKVQSPLDTNAQLSLKTQSFWNESSTQQFINNLIVPNGYWREIINQYSPEENPASLTTHDIEQKINNLMIQGKLRMYPVEIPDAAEHPPENRVIKSSNDVIYRFMPTSALLMIKNATVKQFQSSTEAKVFISELNPSDEKLATIASELKINIPNTASVNKEETINAVSAAMVAGSIVIIEDKISSPPSDKSKVEEVKDTTGNRRADTVTPVEDEFKEINIELIDEFDKNAAAFYKLFDDLEFKIKTDQGDEHKGKISNGKIHIPKAKMSSNFELEIKDLPAFMEG